MSAQPDRRLFVVHDSGGIDLTIDDLDDAPSTGALRPANPPRLRGLSAGDLEGGDVEPEVFTTTPVGLPRAPRHPVGERLADAQAGERAPVLLTWVSSKEDGLATAAWLAQHGRNAATFHAVRTPPSTPLPVRRTAAYRPTKPRLPDRADELLGTEPVATSPVLVRPAPVAMRADVRVPAVRAS